MDKVIQFISSPKMILSVITITAAFIIWFIVKKLLRRYLHNSNIKEKINGKKETHVKLFVNLLKYVIFIAALVLVLQINGVNVSSLVAGLGIASAIAGLALQDALKDMIMGANILLDSFFVIGDVVRYKELEGEVIAFSVKTTQIRDIETGDVVTVCNRNISEITRLSDHFDINIQLPYGADAVRVNDAMSEISEDMNEVGDVHRCEYLGLQQFGESAVTYRLRIFCLIKHKPDIRRAANRIIQTRLEKYGLNIPFNQLEVKIHS